MNVLGDCRVPAALNAFGQQPWRVLLAQPVLIALGVTVIFSIRFADCLPFSGFTRLFNYETVTTLVSFLIYADEPLSFPLGAIKQLAFPFDEANVGNVGALPLFAVAAKLVGKLIPYFRTFDYFVPVEILSCFLTAFFSQLILAYLGVRHAAFLALGALLAGTSFLLLTRSAASQPFCVVEFPLFAAWIYAMLLTLQNDGWNYRRHLFVAGIFPIAALVDSYALFGMLLGTGALLAIEVFEAAFGGLNSSRKRAFFFLFLCVGGVGLSILALYLIGMFPLPPVPRTFTSYDFGIGGRYHTADLFGPWIPVAADTPLVSGSSLPVRLGFPFATDRLGPGQYEGVAYVGTPIVCIWIGIAALWLRSLPGRFSGGASTQGQTRGRLALFSPWKKVGLAVLAVFVFSLGYELHVFGIAFPDFTGMPASWIADRLPSVYNIRAPGRLAALISFYLIFEAIRRLYYWHAESAQSESPRYPGLGLTVLGVLAVIHFLEIAPFLKPVASQPLHPLGGVFSEREIIDIKRVASGREILLASPSVRATDVKWTSEAFSLAYYSGLRSNLYYLARTHPDHDLLIKRDLDRVMDGNWDALVEEYGRILIAVPAAKADGFRKSMSRRYLETQIGPVSLWSRRNDLN